MIIKRVLENKKTKTKYVIIPAKSDIQAGDYVSVTKLPEMQATQRAKRDESQDSEFGSFSGNGELK